MGKSTLKLTGVYEAWSRNVRQGRLTRVNGTEAAVLVRVEEDLAATPEILTRLREDARLLGRLQHESVLRIEHVSAIAGKVGVVYEGFECASAARILRVLRARNQVLPARAAVEAAAAVGLALDEALRIVDGDRAVHHPAPSPEEVLVDTAGRVKLSGFRVSRPGDPVVAPPKGYAAPEGGAAPAAATYLVGALLVELLSGESPPEAAVEPERHEAAVRRALIRVLARPGDTPGEPVVAAIRQALAHDPAIRGGPGALGKKLRELAVALQSPGLRAWAPGSIPSVQRFAAPAAEGRAVPGSVLPFPTDDSAARPPLAAGQTLAPLDHELADPPRAPSRQPLPDAMSRAYGAGTIVPPSDISEEALRIGPQQIGPRGPRTDEPPIGRGAPSPEPGAPSPESRKAGAPGRAVASRAAGSASGPQSPPSYGAPPMPPQAPLPVTSTGVLPRPGNGANEPTRPTSGAPRPEPAGPAIGRMLPGPANSSGPALTVPPRVDGPAIASTKRPPGLSPMGPILDPISDGDESEATVVAGHRRSGPEAPIDPLADDEPPAAVRPAILSPSISAAPSRSVASSSVLDEDTADAPPKRSLLVPILLGIGALGVAALLVVGIGIYAVGSGLEEVEVPATPTAVAPLEGEPVPPSTPPVEAPTAPPPAAVAA
ncbi:MAG: hypothetical protein Q8P41_20460, partial [Pseudomonadota bacterium]|nr:hypothetical protein [Pseudomonadota bacterium]